MNTKKINCTSISKRKSFSSKKCKKWITQKLAEIIEICLTPEPVLNKQGEPTGQFTRRASEALKALELLGKSCGLFSNQDTSSDMPSIGQKDLVLLKKVSERIFDGCENDDI